MANRNTLHKNALWAFKEFLDKKGIEHRPGEGHMYEILQVKLSNGWYKIYTRDYTEHYTVQDKLMPLVWEWINKRREKKEREQRVEHEKQGFQREYFYE